MRQTIIYLFLCVSFGAFGQTNEEDSLTMVEMAYWDSIYAEMPSFIPYKSGEKWALYDLNSDSLYKEYAFDDWVPQGDFSDYYAFKNNGQFGVIASSGDTVMPFEYDTVVTTMYGVIGCKGQEWYFPIYKDYGMDVVIESEEDLEEKEVVLLLDSISEHDEFIYLHRNNKVGAYLRGHLALQPDYVAIQPLNLIELYAKSPEAILAFDGTNFRFFDFDGNDLLGTATPEFELMRNNFVRYKNQGRWFYYNFFTKKQFDSQGNDVVIYSAHEYKVYGADRKYPTYYSDQKKLLGYEDYFPLISPYVAFRSGGKIGLMDLDGTVYISPRYDKVESIGDMYSELDYFKFFRGDSCGLVTKNGTELFQPAFANIIETKDPDRLIVTDNGFTGVVNKRGKILIPLKYHYIQYGRDCFFLQTGNKIGLASADGDIIFEPQFKTYREFKGRYRDDKFYCIVFKDFAGKYQLANNRGGLATKKFDDFNYGNQTFKLYRKGEIEVAILSDDAELDETAIYPNVGVLEVKSDKFGFRVAYGLQAWEPSYLEENQLNSKFGLRFFKKRGLAVEPVYKEIQQNRLNGYFGERLDEGTFELIDDITLRRRSTYDQMYIGAAAVKNTDLISAESVVHHTSSNWSYTVVGQNKDNHGTIELPDISMPFSFGELEEMNIRFSRQFGPNIPKMYLIDNTPVLCHRDSSEISLFEYYHYFNMLGGLRLTKESAATIMNPNLGVRFEGGMRRVSDLNSFRDNATRLRFDPYKNFYDFRFTEMEDFVLSKNVGDTLLWNLRDYRWTEDSDPLPSRKCIDYKEIPYLYGTLLELKEPGTTNFIIHEDYPDFKYILNDSLERNYYAGRLIGEDEDGVQLTNPSGTIYVSNRSEIKYLGEGIFAVKSGAIWEVINRDGEAIFDKQFTVVKNVSNGYFAAGNGELRGIYSVTEEVLVESDQFLRHLEESLYEVRNKPQMVWYDAETKVFDTIRSDEDYLGNRTFITELDDDSYFLRKFGSSEQMDVSSEINPYCVQEAVVFKQKKKLFVLDSEGEITAHKKASKPREYGKFLRIEGKKNKLILNSKGQLIHTVDDDARLKTHRDQLMIHTSDTTYLVSQTGATTALNEEKITPFEQPANDDIEIVLESGKFGALRNGEPILETEYDRLKHIGDGEFAASQKHTVNLFDAKLERLNPIPYHNSYLIDEDVLVIELNGQWYFYRKGENWEKLKAK